MFSAGRRAPLATPRATTHSLHGLARPHMAYAERLTARAIQQPHNCSDDAGDSEKLVVAKNVVRNAACLLGQAGSLCKQNALLMSRSRSSSLRTNNLLNLLAAEATAQAVAGYV